MPRRRSSTALVVSLSAAAAANARPPSFTPTGVIDNSGTGFAFNLSADARTFTAYTRDRSAILWRDPASGGAGAMDIGRLPGSEGTTPQGVSGDGSVVVAWIRRINHLDTQDTGIWTDPAAGGAGWVLLPPPSGYSEMLPRELSHDGRWVVGGVFRPDSAYVGYRRTITDYATGAGVLEELSFPSTATDSLAFDVSADGRFVVGAVGVYSAPLSLIGSEDAAMWIDGVYTDLGAIGPGTSGSHAAAVSDDGQVVVGEAWYTAAERFDQVPFRWTPTAGMHELPVGPPPLVGGIAFCTSGDGASIGGMVFEEDQDNKQAALWRDGQLTIVSDLLIGELGIDVSHWRLEAVRGISQDGLTFLGSGYSMNPPGPRQAWIVHLGSTCPGDMDGDDVVDVFDLLAYLTAWFSLDAAAERTGDDPANIDVFDLLVYLDEWFAGC